MSNFQNPYQKIAWLQRRLDALESMVRKVVTPGGVVNSGTSSGPTVLGVPEIHTHLGTGEGGTIDTLIDNDNDTSVKVETSADEDIVRIVTGGTGRARVSSAGLLIVNGSDVTIYSDDGSTQVGQWDGATGHLAIGTTVNTARAINIIKTLSGTAKAIHAAITASGAGTGPVGIDLTLTSTAAIAGAILADYSYVHNAAGNTGDVTVMNFDATISGAGHIAGDLKFMEFSGVYGGGVGDPTAAVYGIKMNDVGHASSTAVYPIYVATQTGTVYSVHAPAIRIGSVTPPTNVTAGDLTATRLIVPNATIVHSAVSQLGGPVVIPAQGALRLSDTDNSHYTGLKAHGTTTASVEYTLPPADGTAGYQLTTDGAGVLSWAAAGSGGAGAHDHTAADGSGVLTNDAHDGYQNITAIATPASPVAGDIRLFARTSGNNIELVMISATGAECVLCSIVNIAHTNKLAANWIE